MFTSILCHAKTNTFLPLAGTGGHPKVWGFSSTEYVILIFSSILAKYVQRKTPACFIFSIHLKIPILSDVGTVILFLNLTFHF